MLNPVTYKFSKSKQLEAIKKIVQEYPTGNDFKKALLSSDNKKLTALAQTIPDNMSRYQYIDFLQYVFIKYNGHGKFLSTILSGIGLGILANYLGVYLGVTNDLDKKSVAHRISDSISDMANLDSPLTTLKNDIYKNGLKNGIIGAASGIAGGIGGAAATNSILNWRDNNIQKEIENLKKTNNKTTLNYMYNRGLL